MSGRHRERDEEVSPAPVVECGLAEILGDLLRNGMDLGIMHGILGKDPGLAVHQIVLAEVRCGEELKVETGFAYKCLRHGLAQDDLDEDALVLGSDPEPGGEVIIPVGHFDLDAAVGLVNLPGGDLAEDIPLLRSVHQTDASAGADALTPLDDLQTGELLVVETAVIEVVVHEHVGAPRLEIIEVIHFQALSIRTQGHRGGQGRHCNERKVSHK